MYDWFAALLKWQWSTLRKTSPSTTRPPQPQCHVSTTAPVPPIHHSPSAMCPPQPQCHPSTTAPVPHINDSPSATSPPQPLCHKPNTVPVPQACYSPGATHPPAKVSQVHHNPSATHPPQSQCHTSTTVPVPSCCTQNIKGFKLSVHTFSVVLWANLEYLPAPSPWNAFVSLCNNSMILNKF